MPSAAALPEIALAGGAIALMLTGAAAAYLSPNVVKRLVGLTLAGFGACAALAALQAPQAALIAAVAIMFAQLAVGVAICVRLQEAYGTIETPQIDAADAGSEQAGPSS